MASPRSSYQPGDHVCTLYSTPEEHVVAAVEAIRAGLARGEKCTHICGEHATDAFRAELHRAGIDVAEEERRGAISVKTRHESYLEGETFDPLRMLAHCEASYAEALREGFSGLCAMGDMNWVLDGVAGTERLVQYEALLNPFFATRRAIGLCQYNRRTIPAQFLDDALATHPLLREGPHLLSNPMYGWRELSDPRPESIERKLRVIRTANEVGGITSIPGSSG